jgi:ketosteroid isomerase-like protein
MKNPKAKLYVAFLAIGISTTVVAATYDDTIKTNAQTMTAPVATSPEKATDVFMYYFNEGDMERLIKEYYAKNGILAVSPGQAVQVAQRDKLREALKPYFALKGKMTGITRHTLIASDTALLIIDWVVDYNDKDGKPAQYPGTSTDVVRKGKDGIWRAIIDNPYNIK